MSPLDFCNFLRGYFELTDSDKPLSAQQAQIIKDHLELVFKKEMPKYKSYGLSYTGVYENPNPLPIITEIGWVYTPTLTNPYIKATC